ncbi:MAG: hypothetical protein ACI31M_04120 [Bacilli bacterium]
MKVILRDNEYKSKDIHLIDGNKTLTIMFGGTGDLYWIINNKDCPKTEDYSYDYFVITKENYAIYSIFEQLVNDIKNINIFDKKEIEFPPYVETDEGKKEYLEELELDKKRYRKYNMAYYNDLCNEKTDIITWVSDETAFEVANKVQIKKIEDIFVIEFYTQPYIEGYEREDNMLGIMGIRFRNSGSRYQPFNIVFMRMFSQLQKLDDVNDYGHQIHIEEYLYKKGLVRR